MKTQPRQLLTTLHRSTRLGWWIPLLLLMALWLTGCPPIFAIPSPTPVVTPAPPTDTPTPTPTPTDTPTPTPTPTDTPELALPGEELLSTLPDSLFQASQAASLTGGVPLPEGIVDLEVLVGVLQEVASDLVNPEILDLWEESGGSLAPQEVFALDRATTYALREGQGVIFQSVSLRLTVPEGPSLDEYLADYENWQDRPMLIGALQVYQSADWAGKTVGLGLYAVLLRYDGGVPEFWLVGQGAEHTGEWVLRELPLLAQPHAPVFTFVTRGQICYSQQKLQACLRLAPPGFGERAERILAVADQLVAAGLLPSSDAVNAERAFGGIAGPDVEEGCLFTLANREPQACQPDLLIAAAEAYAEVTADQVELPGRLDRGLFGIAVLEVNKAIEGRPVVDQNGAQVTLPAGIYRLDLLLLEGAFPVIIAPNRTVQSHLGQLVASPDGKRFYVPMIPMEIEGTLLFGAQEEDRLKDEIILGSIFDGLCTSQEVFGYEPPCAAPKNRTPWCIYIGDCS